MFPSAIGWRFVADGTTPRRAPLSAYRNEFEPT